MQFFKSSLGSFIWIAVKLCSNFCVNKIVSISFGPAGIALLAHFQNFFSAFIILCNEGINKGVVKYLSDSTQSRKEANQIFTAGLVFNVIVYLFIICLILLFSHPLGELFHVAELWIWVVALILAIGLMLMQYFLLSVFLAWQKVLLYNLINTLGTAITVPLVYYSSIHWGLAFTILIATVGVVAIAVITLAIFMLVSAQRVNISNNVNKQAYQKIFKFILMATGIMLFGKLTDIGVRQVALDFFEIKEVGLWQTSVKISDYYTTAFTAILAIIYFPKIAALLTQPSQLRKFMFQSASLLMPLSILGFAFVYIFRQFFIVQLFSTDFINAEKYIGMQLLTDLLKFAAFFLVFLLTAQAKTLLFIVLEGCSCLLYLTLAVLFSKQMGIDGLMLAQFFRYVFYLVFLIILYRKLLWNANENEPA